MPGTITRLYNFLSKLGLPIEPGEVDAELNQLVTAADTAIDDIDALEVDATALTARVAVIEGYDTDNRLDTLEAAADPTQHSVDLNARTLVAAGDASPTAASMLNYDNIIIYTTTNGQTFTLPTPDADMNLRTWRIVNASTYVVNVDFGLNREGDESLAYSPALSDGGALLIMVLPSNAGGTGDYRYYVLSVVV